MGRNMVIAAVSALIFASSASAMLRLDVDMDLVNWKSDGVKALWTFHHLIFVENDDQIGEVIPFSFNGQSGEFRIDHNSIYYNLDGTYSEDKYSATAEFSESLDLSGVYVNRRVGLSTSSAVQTSSTANWLYANTEPMADWDPGHGSLRIWASHNDERVGSASFDNPLAVSASLPESSSWAMMLTGFFFVGGAMRYRRKQAVGLA